MTKLLLVEDNDLFANLLTFFLANEGYTIKRARNGNEALGFYTADTVDLVLTDLVMPGKQGLELIHDLRQLNPQVKIVAMSGGSAIPAELYLEMADHLGAFRTLEKPFGKSELMAALKECENSPSLTENGFAKM